MINLSWFSDNIGSIVILIVLILIIALVVRYLFKKRKNHSCNGDCCSCHGTCSSFVKDYKKNKTK